MKDNIFLLVAPNLLRNRQPSWQTLATGKATVTIRGKPWQLWQSPWKTVALVAANVANRGSQRGKPWQPSWQTVATGTATVANRGNSVSKRGKL